MKLLGADTDLCSKAKFKAVGKAGGSVYIYAGRVHLTQEFLRDGFILRHNGVGMSRIVLINMGDCLLRRTHGFYGNNQVKVFCPVVFFGRGAGLRYLCLYGFVSANFHLFSKRAFPSAGRI